MLMLSDMTLLTPHAPPKLLGSNLMVQDDRRISEHGVKELVLLLGTFCGRDIAHQDILFFDGALGSLYYNARPDSPHVNASANRLRHRWLHKQGGPMEAALLANILGQAVAFKRRLWLRSV